jgi:hypothetical protein
MGPVAVHRPPVEPERQIILQILAFIAFVGAAVGYRYRKVNLIAVGLALWMLSLVFRL